MYYRLKNRDILYNDAQLGPYPDHLLPRVDRPTNIPEGACPRRKFQNETESTVVKKKAAQGEYSDKMNEIINEYVPHKDEIITKSFTDFFKTVILTMRDYQDPPMPDKAPLPDDPRAITRHIKSFAYFMGADAVGVCEVPDYAVFKNNYKGEPFENTYKYAIVFLKRKSPQTTTASNGNDRIFDACSHQVYQLVSVWAQVLAKYITKLGYEALASNQLNYVTVMPAMIIAAGLGESGRMGLAVNPFFGANFKSACVLTNLPLVPDKPIDFGLKKYCDRCHICADVCPAGAISTDNEQEIYNGYLKYKMSYEKHVLLSFVNTNCTSCGACTNMCPWNRPESAPEYFKDWDGSIEELHRRVDERADYLRANNFVTEEQKHNQWWFDLMWDKEQSKYVIPKNAKFEIPPQEETPGGENE